MSKEHKKILILYASVGMGHKRAAEAIEKTFHIIDKDITVTNVDALDYTNVVFKKLYTTSYVKLSEKAPALWGYFYNHYDGTDLSTRLQRLRRAVERFNAFKFKKLLKATNPDAIVCTHFLPLEMLSKMKKKNKLKIPVYCVVTDYTIHSWWVYNCVDKYFVATEEVKDLLLRKSAISDGRVSVSGIPVNPEFNLSVNRTKVRKQLNIADSKKVILILGSALSFEAISAMLSSLRDLEDNFQVLVVAGRNKSLANELKEIQQQFPFNATVLGFVSNMHELLKAVDIFISKAGGVTLTEALVCNTPLIIVHPIPGQEQRNCDYFLEHGAALRLQDVTDVSSKIQTLLNDNSKLEAMRKNISRIARPQAAAQICQEILKPA